MTGRMTVEQHRRTLAGLATAAAVTAMAVIAWAWPHAPMVLGVETVRNETGQDSYDPLSRALSQVVIDQTAKFASITIAAPGARAWVRLEGRLILWNGGPALSLIATNPAGHVVWTGMAEGQEDIIAKLTAAKIVEFGRQIRHGAESDE